ncbi:MAG: Gfo/Idh/MocA family oxidoreductase [Opitutaceae bacterium]|nr:Gfo/Idh/MocA family oxidoreductase [Opitutaceae bacterium]
MKNPLTLAALLALLHVGISAADLRLGLIGLDTSHVIAFTKVYNDPKTPDHVPGGRVVAAFKGGSPDIPSSATRIDGFTKQLTETYGVKLYDSIEELARNVDAILIESVDGRPHLEQFKRTLAAKKPVFIDKPLAGSLRDGLEIARLAREHGIPVFSSSSLRYGPEPLAPKLEKIGAVKSVYSVGPAEYEKSHPDLFWYGIHAVEALYTVMGPGCIRLVRTQTADADVVTGVWADGRVGTMQGNRNGYKGYGLTILGTKGAVTAGEKHSYRGLTLEIMKFFQTGVPPVPLDTTIEILAFMEAADESKRRGGAPVAIADVMKLAQAQK